MSQSCKTEQNKAQANEPKLQDRTEQNPSRTSQSCKAERDKTLRTNGFKAAEGS
ncbi:hypothetical protein JCM6292_254 [Bacteroides pyogenes JCM 6292]|uniref:Uncharacterized protein n=2 Tax=Bacteroides pyogenes TaxID=310300 RepID=W4P3D5_9BACE|nr:hypothetical protein JCM6292_254 [Bacteroides pyogenes JCM 6292]